LAELDGVGADDGEGGEAGLSPVHPAATRTPARRMHRAHAQTPESASDDLLVMLAPSAAGAWKPSG
jgi:hypothetical protein